MVPGLEKWAESAVGRMVTVESKKGCHEEGAVGAPQKDTRQT